MMRRNKNRIDRRQRTSWLALAYAFALLVVPMAEAQRGAITQPIALDHMVANSAVIVRGEVTAVRAEKHPQYESLDTLVITLAVAETFKGRAEKTLTFRQFIWDVRDAYDFAGYRVGQELVLFLAATSRAGLTAPMGLEQGRFRVRRVGKDAWAANGFNNATLFPAMQQDPQRRGGLPERLQKLVMEHRKGALALRDLEELVRLLTGRQP